MAVIASQQEIITQQQKRITELEARVTELEARLNRDSSNSSKPPSSDPPWKAPAKKPLGGRKPGGQAGHKGNQRKLVQPDETVVVKPLACGHCGEALQGDDAEPLRHQVAEIPEVRAHVTEYRLHTLRCGCGKLTAAHLPDGVPRGAFGPRLQAILAVCAGAYRLSKRNIQQLARDFFEVEISVGGISELEEVTSEALEHRSVRQPNGIDHLHASCW
jgi:transposase